jgi:hypothetical protein
VPNFIHSFGGFESTNEEVHAKGTRTGRCAKSCPTYIRGVPWRLFLKKSRSALRATIRCEAEMGEKWNYRPEVLITLHSPRSNSARSIRIRDQDGVFHSGGTEMATANGWQRVTLARSTEEIRNFLRRDGSLRLSAEIYVRRESYLVQ